MTRKLPFRPGNEISQSFNSGLASIYAVTDTAQPGYRPVETPTLTVKVPFENIKLGIQRYYEAKQNQVEIERVIRVPNPGPQYPISNQNIVQLTELAMQEGESPKQYRIELVQMAEGIYPPSLDLTLSRIEQEYSL